MKHRNCIFLIVFLLFASSLYAFGSKESGGHSFSDKDLSRILDRRNDVSFMARALHETGLAEKLNNLEGYTIFIPTDAAVEKMTKRLRDAMSERPDVLSAVLKDIMVKGVFSADELLSLGKIKTMGGITLEIEGDRRNLQVSGSDIKKADLYGNGFVVHIISGITVIDIDI